MPDEPLLKVAGLTTRFSTPEGVVRAVEDVSFEVHRGLTIGVLGESGSGKSVTALSIMRLIADPPGKIVSGSITFAGKDLCKLSQQEMRRIRGKDITMIFQEPMSSLNPVYPVGDQIAEILEIHRGMSRAEAWEKAIEMLDTVGIPSARERIGDYPHQFSGGMRQRVMIAMAITCQPKILIADEPTTALDVTIQAQILDLIQQLQEDLGMAVMLITHDLGVIAECSDEVVVMYAGQVVERLPQAKLFEFAAHPYTQGLLRSMPRLGEKFINGKKPLAEIKGNTPNLIRLPRGCPFAPRCPAAMARCREEKPPFFRIAPDHGSRCWLSEDDARAVDNPAVTPPQHTEA